MHATIHLDRLRLAVLPLLVLLGASAGCSESSAPTGPGEPMPAVDGPLPSGEYVFVLNRAGRDVSVLSAAAGYAEVRRLTLPHIGPAATDIAVDASSRTLYATFPDSQTTIVALGMDGVELGRTQVLGRGPELALEATRRLLAVAVGTGVEFLDSASLQSRARVVTGQGRIGAWDVTFAPGAAKAVVSNALRDEIVLVTLDGFQVVARTPVGSYPTGAAVAGNVVYVAANHADRVDAVSLDDGRLLASVATGNGPIRVAADAARSRAYVAADLGGEIGVLDLATGIETTRWRVHHAVGDVALSGDGGRLFVCRYGAGRVEILDAATGEGMGASRVGDGPSALDVAQIP